MESNELIIAAATLGLALAVSACDRDETGATTDTTPDTTEPDTGANPGN